MAEVKQILELWKRAQAAGDEVCLATVVGIEGSAYRRPGARMLLTASGQRAGTVSGGCLEGEIAKKAWWLTETGPSLQRYSSFFDDDGDMPYGLGCGGTVFVLLERGAAAEACLEALGRSVEERTASVIVTATDTNGPGATNQPGTVLIVREDGSTAWQRGARGPAAAERAESLARETLQTRGSQTAEPEASRYFAEYVAPPPLLWVFGAGDDAQPLVEFAAALGWHVVVADGRSQLARAERFPQAARVMDLEKALTGAGAGDAAVILTHSYEQDRIALGALLGIDLKYLGILGPRARTERLVGEVAPGLGLGSEEILERLHSPVGLDLGAHSPAAIALSIAAELQAVLAGRGAKKLKVAKMIHG
ncbi:MAG: XdhC family protein [Acidobacteriaceae bacterium]